MREKRYTVLELIRLAAGYLAEKGVATARLDAEVLLGHVLGLDRVALYVQFDRPLTADEVTAYRRAVARRGRREPVAQIVGSKEFFSLDFLVTRDVLTPRPETELLVEVGLRFLQERAAAGAPQRILDVGTGSGVLAVTLAKHLPAAQVWATDVSSAALEVAAANARRHGVAERIRFAQGEWTAPAAVAAPFDLIVSNPPYIPGRDIEGLAPEVREYEPRLALDGGADGLDAYRALLPEALQVAAPGGLVAVEVGDGQADAVERIGVAAGLRAAKRWTDLAGRERVVTFTR